MDVSVDDVEEQQEIHSEQDEQNLRFWSAVLRDFAFSDTTVEIPPPVKDSTLYVRVRNSGYSGWALCFDGWLGRSASTFGCFLMVRRDYQREVRIHEQLVASLEELRTEMGDELEHWQNAAGRPRIGFRRQGSLDFLAQDEESEEFCEAVAWMRRQLDLLVSALNPRLQSMLADER